jgi:hypothetical protein
MANLHKSLKSLKVKVNQILPGYLGVSDTLINVPNRPGFSYVRLLGNPNELIQAYNTSVTPIYGFPVLVQWTGNKYVVIGKDTNRYSQWNYSAYLPLHGETHQWKGGDMTWILSEQLYPLAVSPSGSSLLIAPYAYTWQGNWVFGGNSDTTSITLPSNPAKQSVLLLYLDGPTGNPTWLPGTEAPLYTDKNSLLPYLPNFSSSLGIPLAMVRIPSGTTSWAWDNLYDVRQLFVGFTTTSGSSTTGSSGGNVYGPATNNDSYIPQWNGANSKTLKNGAQLVTSVGTPGSDSSVPSEKAVRTALSSVTGSSGTGNFSITGTSVANHFISLADSSGKTGIDSGYGPGSFSGTGSNYVLPTASPSVLGGVKIGARLTMTGDVLSADVQTGSGTNYSLPTGSNSILGGFRVGTGLSVYPDGTLNVTGSFTSGSSGIGEAPIDGTPYVRQDATWIPMPTSGGIFPGPTISYQTNWGTGDGAFSGPAGSHSAPMWIDFGDGAVAVVGENHSYLADGTKTLRLWMNDWTLLTTFYCNWSHCVGLIPSFALCTNLTELVIDNNAWTGTVPDMSALTLLTKFYIQSNSTTGYTAGSFATQANLSDIEIQGNSWDDTAVNSCLHDLVTSLSLGGRVVASVDLSGGSMAAPTGTGITDAAALVTAGWTVSTN